MNDFSDVEDQLRNLRPATPSAGLIRRVETALADAAVEDKIVRPQQFRLNWLWLGTGLATAALVLLFLRIDLQNISRHPGSLAAISPIPSANRAAVPATFLPAGATQVVYHTRDEGLFFPAHSDAPVRKVRSVTHETLQWRNVTTGASLRISYPTERLDLIPVSGQ